MNPMVLTPEEAASRLGRPVGRSHPKFIELKGRVFGLLTVIDVIEYRRFAKRDTYEAMWECQCACGKKTVKRGFSLRTMDVKSCGCIRPNNRNKYPREYKSWLAMRSRCQRKGDAAYAYYGGRGIKICPRWLDGEGGKNPFNLFLEDMGARPFGHSLDRINHNGDYEPGNCRWATAKQQIGNRRKMRVNVDGVRLDLSDALQVSCSVLLELRRKLGRKLSVQEVFDALIDTIT